MEISEETVLPKNILLSDVIPTPANETHVEQVTEVTEVKYIEQDILVQTGPHIVQDTIGKNTDEEEEVERSKIEQEQSIVMSKGEIGGVEVKQGWNLVRSSQVGQKYKIVEIGFEI